MNTTTTIRLEIPAALKYLSVVSEVLADVLDKCGTLPDHQQTVYNIQLAVQEACTNIIDHAYGGDERERIAASILTTATHIEIELVDHGQSFDINRIPRVELDSPQVHGYGLYLIHQLMDDVRYEVKPDGNHWWLVKAF